MSSIIFNKPATKWEEALPIGNGRLGAMIYGGVGLEKLQLNEDSMFFGSPVDRLNKDAISNLSKVRKLIIDGELSKAERLLKLAFSGTPPQGRPYQPIGELDISFHNKSEILGYNRELALDTAIHNTSYKQGGIQYKHRIFASYPDNIIAMRLSADKSGAISFDARLSRGNMCEYVKTENGNSLVLGGTLGHGGLSYALMLRVEAIGGSIETLGDHIIVHSADDVILLLTGYTTWYKNEPEAACENTLDKAVILGWDNLVERHVTDYDSLFARVKLTLPESQWKYNMYFDYGRYLMIACSRQGTMPANLQGIWNPHMNPPWDSRYTININTEMNYWPAESCNLPECHEPLFEFTKRLVENGRRVAKEMYGCRGSVAHHNGDLYNDALPYDHYTPATIWVLGAAWLCIHMWKHYEYTLDIDFLKECFPYMRDSALFFEDFLTENDGYLVTNPTVSPENTYRLDNGQTGSVCAGCTMDNVILRDLLTACITASELLGMPENERSTLKKILTRIAPLQVGKHGQIMEWLRDYDEVEPGHRHISQLYALYPSGEITPNNTPELAKAAKATLERRLTYGGGHTGWSRAWIANLYAHLWQGDEALKHLSLLLSQSTLPNWLDNHPPFQIDGNFGGTACIAEMLVQSQSKNIYLLPALPKAWAKGSVAGLKLPGNLTVDIAWDDGCLTNAKITGCSDRYNTVVHYKDDVWEIKKSSFEILPHHISSV